MKNITRKVAMAWLATPLLLAVCSVSNADYICGPGQFHGSAQNQTGSTVCGGSVAQVCALIVGQWNANPTPPDYNPSYYMEAYWVNPSMGLGGISHCDVGCTTSDGEHCTGESQAGIAAEGISYFGNGSNGLGGNDPGQSNGNNCPAEGNPINPSNGNKFQTEVDYQGGGDNPLSLFRTYNSNTTDFAELGFNWVHNYMRRVTRRTEAAATAHDPNNVLMTSTYTAAAYACESGWNQIKNHLPNNLGTIAYADFEYDGPREYCAVKLIATNEMIGVLPINLTRATTLPPDPTIVESISITRPDGKSYYFSYQGSEKIKSLNTRATLSEVVTFNGNNVESTTLKLVDENDNIELYDVEDRLKSIQSRSGHLTTFEYEPGSDRLSKVTNHHGLELNFTYTVGGLIDYITDPAGQTIKYYYTNDILTSVEYQDTKTTTYLYEKPTQPRALTGILNERSERVSTWDYDSQGRAVLSYRGPENDRVDNTTFQFVSEIETKVTDAANAERVYHYGQNAHGAKRLNRSSGDACQACGSTGAESKYDEYGYINEMTDYGGNKTSYTYDEFGREESRTEGLGSTVERTVSTLWEPGFRVPDIITEESVFSNQVLTTDHTYNGFGWLKKKTVDGFSHDGTPVSRVTDYYYLSEQEGDIAQIDYIDGPRTDVNDYTTYTYYTTCDNGNVCGRLGQIHTITNADGHVTEFLSYDSHSRIESWKDANGLETKYTYDLRGRADKIELIPPVASGLATRTIDYVYYDNGLVHTVDTPASGIMTFEYNTAELLTKVTDPFGNELVLDYDSRGNLTDQDIYQGSESAADLRYTVGAVFDLLGQLSEMNNDFYTEYFDIDADGNLKKHTDGRSTVVEPIETIYEYDALNRLEKIQDALNGTAKTQMVYDAQDRVTSITTPTNVVTEYKYDDLDNLRQEISPDRGTTTYVPDEAGNVKTETNAENEVAQYTYDSLNRVTNVDFPGSPNLNVEYIYDYDGMGSSPYGIGRLTKMVDETGQTEYEYNAFGEITAETKNYTGHPPSQSVTIGYDYDNGGNLTTLTYPSGRIVTFGRDLQGRVSSITSEFPGSSPQLTNILSSVDYEPFGPAKLLTYGNNVTDDRIFDTQYRLTRKTLNNGTIDLFDYDYDFDLSSNVDNRIDLNNVSDESTFTYDVLNRLDTAVNSSTFGALDYGYDGNGNRDNLIYDSVETITLTEIAPTASNRIDKLTDDNNLTLIDYTVDLAGRMTAKDEIGVFKWVYEYNDAGRLWKVHSDDLGVLTEIVSYTYNGLGQRASKTIAGQSLYFVYTSAGQLIAELDANGISVAEYVYFNDEPIAVLGSDRDGDGLLDTDDNCVAHANPTQRDSDSDGFGNRCDPDFDGNGIVNFLDLPEITTSPYFLTSCPVDPNLYPCHEDLDGDGGVNWLDYSIATSMIFQPPGPKGAGYGTPNSGTLWIHNDHLGTPIRLTNDQTSVVWQSDARPFGSASLQGSASNTLTDENPDMDGTPTVFNLRMPGQYHDAETGLSYNYFRYYDPSTGRYVTSDPIGLEGGLNTYLYADANPKRYADPTGEVPIVPIVIAFCRINPSACVAAAAGIYIAADKAVQGLHGALSNVHVGPWSGSTTRPSASDAGTAAAGEVAGEMGGSCDTDDPEECKKAAKKCKRKCIDKAIEGHGGPMREWIQRCHNACTEKLGCGNFFR